MALQQDASDVDGCSRTPGSSSQQQTRTCYVWVPDARHHMHFISAWVPLIVP